MRNIIVAVVLVVAGLGLGAGIASADPAEVRVSQKQVGAECFAQLGDAGFPVQSRFGRDVRDVPVAKLLTECGIWTVQASDGSLVPSTFYRHS